MTLMRDICAGLYADQVGINANEKLEEFDKLKTAYVSLKNGQPVDIENLRTEGNRLKSCITKLKEEKDKTKHIDIVWHEFWNLLTTGMQDFLNSQLTGYDDLSPEISRKYFKEGGISAFHNQVLAFDNYENSRPWEKS